MPSIRVGCGRGWGGNRGAARRVRVRRQLSIWRPCPPMVPPAAFSAIGARFHGSDSNKKREAGMTFGLLILRLVVGLTMAAHGSQKLFGWFGGHGLTGTGGFLEQLGFVPGRRNALFAGLAEFMG